MQKKNNDPLKEEFGEDFVDLFIKLKGKRLNKKHQFRKIFSDIYKCEEYVWQGELKKDEEIKILHADLRKVPNILSYNQISGPGITFSGGEACMDLKCKKALVCPVNGVDLIYNFVDDDTKLYYTGKTGVKTLFIRIYDNTNGNENDRWLVISLE